MSTDEKISLSPRELEVAQRAARGDTDYAIAVDLGISVHTVDNHWRRIFTKTLTHSRTAAIARLGVSFTDPRQLFLFVR